MAMSGGNSSIILLNTDGDLGVGQKQGLDGIGKSID